MVDDLITVTNIEHAGPDRRARMLYVSDDSPDYIEPISTSAEVVKALDIAVGSSFSSSDLLCQEIVQSEFECAKQRCLRILGSRDRTKLELETRLKQDGYCREVRESVVHRFIEVGLIDETRFAASYVRMAVARKLGWPRIIRELRLKGIGEADINSAYNEYDTEGEAERASSLIRTVDISIPKGKDKALRRLISKGYDFGFSRTIIGDACQGNGNDSDL